MDLRASLALWNLKNVHGSVTFLEMSFSVTNVLIGSSSISTMVNIKDKNSNVKYINPNTKVAGIIKYTNLKPRLIVSFVENYFKGF